MNQSIVFIKRMLMLKNLSFLNFFNRLCGLKMLSFIVHTAPLIIDVNSRKHFGSLHHHLCAGVRQGSGAAKAAMNPKHSFYASFGPVF